MNLIAEPGEYDLIYKMLTTVRKPKIFSKRQWFQVKKRFFQKQNKFIHMLDKTFLVILDNDDKCHKRCC